MLTFFVTKFFRCWKRSICKLTWELCTLMNIRLLTRLLIFLLFFDFIYGRVYIIYKRKEKFGYSCTIFFFILCSISSGANRNIFWDKRMVQCRRNLKSRQVPSDTKTLFFLLLLLCVFFFSKKYFSPWWWLYFFPPKLGKDGVGGCTTM